MAKVIFEPGGTTVEVEPATKLLAAAIRGKVNIRFGCASCRCGTCGVAIKGGSVRTMRPDEKALLAKMALKTDGSVRLACQTRVMDGDVHVDLTFQNTYSPDQGSDEEDDEDDDDDE